MQGKYRADVDGLRAVAVVPVVLFHAGVPGFGGGYVGVDVFFVISGYLITGILLRSLQARCFSLAEFYERRIRRIVPALIAMLAGSTACSIWLTFPDEFTNFGKSLFATALFYANYHFMSDTGYFAAPAEGKPLLHMWSLAVEEQFYLIFPLYVYVACRWVRSHLLQLTLAIALLSLAYSLWLVDRSPDQGFYSAPARAWELLCGALLAILVSRRPVVLHPAAANALTFFGLILIGSSVMTYSDHTTFPGAAALPPVLGAMAVLHAGNAPGNWVSRCLTVTPVRFVGLISYSMYLWHWPVLVFGKAWHIDPLSGLDRLFLLAAIFGLAVLSWRFVERPFRRGGGRQTRRMALAIGVATLSGTMLAGALFAVGNGWPGRFDARTLETLAAKDDAPRMASCQDLQPGRQPSMPLCSVGDPTAGLASFAVWGDSHAEALLPAIDASARSIGIRGVAYTPGGCPPLVGVRQTREGFQDCAKRAEVFLEYLMRHSEIRQVVLASRWTLYATGVRFLSEAGHSVQITDNDDDIDDAPISGNRQVFERGLARTLKRLETLQVTPVLVGQVPESEFRVPHALARAAHLGRAIDVGPSTEAFERRQFVVNAILSSQPGHSTLKVIRPDRALCDAVRCVAADSGRPLYRDSNHLTATQAAKLAYLFDDVLCAGDSCYSRRQDGQMSRH